MSTVNPHLETLKPWTRAGIRRTVPMAELATAFGQIFQEVAAAIGAAGGTIVGPAYGCYFGIPTEVVDVEIGFGIAGPVASDAVTVTDVPQARAVVGTHVGPYDAMEASYSEFMGWMSAQDLHLADHMYEFYDSPPGTDPAQTITRIVFPLA